MQYFRIFRFKGFRYILYLFSSALYIIISTTYLTFLILSLRRPSYFLYRVKLFMSIIFFETSAELSWVSYDEIVSDREAA